MAAQIENMGHGTREYIPDDQLPKEDMQKYDKDHDGKLSKDERAQMDKDKLAEHYHGAEAAKDPGPTPA